MLIELMFATLAPMYESSLVDIVSCNGESFEQLTTEFKDYCPIPAGSREGFPFCSGTMDFRIYADKSGKVVSYDVQTNELPNYIIRVPLGTALQLRFNASEYTERCFKVHVKYNCCPRLITETRERE